MLKGLAKHAPQKRKADNPNDSNRPPVKLVSRKSSSCGKKLETYMLEKTKRYVCGITEKQSKDHFELMRDLKLLIDEKVISTKSGAIAWVESMLQQLPN